MTTMNVTGAVGLEYMFLLPKDTINSVNKFQIAFGEFLRARGMEAVFTGKDNKYCFITKQEPQIQAKLEAVESPRKADLTRNEELDMVFMKTLENMDPVTKARIMDSRYRKMIKEIVLPKPYKSKILQKLKIKWL